MANLSLNSDFNPWISEENTLKKLNMLFFHSKTSTLAKELIQILIANLTFTEDVHE